MRRLFPYAQEAIDNTQKIADRCNVEIEFGVTKLPEYQVPEGLRLLELSEPSLRGGHEKAVSPGRRRLKKAAGLRAWT